jgi:hypothetical protein
MTARMNPTVMADIVPVLAQTLSAGGPLEAQQSA